MVAKWVDITLGEVLTLQRGFDLPAQDRQPGSVPIISSSGMTGTHTKARVVAPGVITGRYGTVGEVFYVTENFWPLNTTLYVKDFKGNDPRFIYYLLKSLDFSAYSDKSSVPGVNRNHLHLMPVKIPSSVTEQRAIAHILGTLDDKIELNRRMNQTLEEIVRAIFKSWFIDFDPVRAKAAGRQPAGMDAATAALFPSEFEDSELGEIPRGSKVSTLGSLATNPRRIMNPKSLPPDTPYIGLEHMPRRSIALNQWGAASQVDSGKYEFIQGEILFGKLRPYFHKVGAPAVSGICSTDILVIEPDQPEWFSFILALVSSDEVVSYADLGSHGTRMPRTDWKQLSEYPICLPPCELISRFDYLVRPLVERIWSNIADTMTLTSIRDALLPKLLSGEVRVADCEAVV